MVATQPKFNVEFKEDAVLAIQRQERGTVLMILKDTTNATIDRKAYRGLGDVVKADFTAENYNRLTLAFLGNPSKVVVIKSDADFINVQKKLDYFNNYILCYPEADATEQTAMINYIKVQREKNNYSTVILGNATAPDAYYAVNLVAEDIKANVNGAETEFTVGDYTARLAGALSGLSDSRSATYYELPELVDCTLPESPDADVANGKIDIIHQDGTFKFGRAVNSLTTLGDGLTEAFQKVRIVDILDEIANDVVTTFRTGYVGKYTNNFSNKSRFVGAINAYLQQLVREGKLEAENDNKVKISYDKTKLFIEGKGVSTEGMSYQDVIRYNTGSNVFLDGVCSPTDAMEDLDIGMYLFQALQAE